MATPRVSSSSPEGQSLRDALAQLRLRLLDLTGRNRLLNYRHPIGKSLQFVEGQPAALFAKLAEGKSAIAIKGLPEPARADWEQNLLRRTFSHLDLRPETGRHLDFLLHINLKKI